MNFDEFIYALYRAGWDSPCDAQWAKARILWETICEKHANLSPYSEHDK